MSDPYLEFLTAQCVALQDRLAAEYCRAHRGRRGEASSQQQETCEESAVDVAKGSVVRGRSSLESTADSTAPASPHTAPMPPSLEPPQLPTVPLAAADTFSGDESARESDEESKGDDKEDGDEEDIGGKPAQRQEQQEGELEECGTSPLLPFVPQEGSSSLSSLHPNRISGSSSRRGRQPLLQPLAVRNSSPSPGVSHEEDISRTSSEIEAGLVATGEAARKAIEQRLIRGDSDREAGGVLCFQNIKEHLEGSCAESAPMCTGKSPRSSSDGEGSAVALPLAGPRKLTLNGVSMSRDRHPNFSMAKDPSISEKDSDASSSDSDSSSSSDEFNFSVADIWMLPINLGAGRTRANSIRIKRGSLVHTLIDKAMRRGSDPVTSTAGPSKDSESDEDLQERRRISIAELVGSFMMEPYSRAHLTWLSVSLFLIIYDLVTIPLEAFNPPATPFSTFMSWTIRIFWVFDLCLNFRTGYVDEEGKVEMNAWHVRRHYLRMQFPFDVFVILADWTEVIIGLRATGFLKSWRLLRLVRFLRLKKAKKIWANIKERFRSDRLVVMAAICKMLTFLISSSHMIACSWRALDSFLETERSEDYLDDSWSVEERYMQAFHWAISIFFGEHVLMPVGLSERCFTSLCLCLTFTLQIWFVSFITTAMTHLEIISTRRSSQFSDLNRYMIENSVPREVALKVERSAQHAVTEKERNKPEREIELLNLISEPLKMTLRWEIHWPILRSHPFFRCYASVNSAGVRNICSTGVEVMTVTKDDIIFHDLEAPRKNQMFFVINGTLQYTGQQGSIQVMRERQWISEAVLWTPDWVHCGTLQASTDARLLCLDASVFQETVAHYSSEHARKYAIGFVEYINDLTAEEHSDIGMYNKGLGRLLGRIFPEEFSSMRAEFDTPLLKKSGTSSATSSLTGQQWAALVPAPVQDLLDGESASRRPSTASGRPSLKRPSLQQMVPGMASRISSHLSPPPWLAQATAPPQHTQPQSSSTISSGNSNTTMPLPTTTCSGVSNPLVTNGITAVNGLPTPPPPNTIPGISSRVSSRLSIRAQALTEARKTRDRTHSGMSEKEQCRPSQGGGQGRPSQGLGLNGRPSGAGSALSPERTL